MEVLSNKGKSVGINNLPNIFESYEDRKQVLLQSLWDSPHFINSLKNGRPADIDKKITSWLDMIKNYKNNLISPEMCNTVAERIIYESYNNGLRASNALDFDDLLLLTYRLFIERPKIADFYRRQFKYICIC
jgi:DNA helicase-2/ATP-dependent DNA helicase PcrA